MANTKREIEDLSIKSICILGKFSDGTVRQIHLSENDNDNSEEIPQRQVLQSILKITKTLLVSEDIIKSIDFDSNFNLS